MDKRAFGQALAAEREAHGMSAEGFASAVGIPHSEYLTYERGEVLPSLELAQTFAEALGVPIDRLTSTTYVPPLRMGKEDGISKAETEQSLKERSDDSVKRYDRGRRIMQIIIAVNIVSLVLSLFTQNIITTVFEIVMLVCLWRGQTWARLVYVLLTAVGTLITFAVTGRLLDMNILLGVLALTETAWGVAVCVLLLSNRSVEEFLYEQSTQG